MEETDERYHRETPVHSGLHGGDGGRRARPGKQPEPCAPPRSACRPCAPWALGAAPEARAGRAPSSPRLAAAENPDPTEEWDVPQMKKEVESLQYQLAFKREMASQTIPELLKWIEDSIPKDPFLNPDLMKNNPWVEKGKCAIL
ncbi:guanine nucleotide-binding protein G(I)/G(S)/G(O) subunit gamma-13 [Dasypus novemcinctus]|uniref:guanine nucleotide-binding protein G(I)/G(S)/G(O) subunit gamma-13 n=1 Tax=Dasypus novemcinctus TaxID=9361 RepID=UPI00265DA103|nr:guanine nucleotide-binding protein G(I)/G(S)/G(O) subunit gamma-13 [Dasypus novemcinctus]